MRREAADDGSPIFGCVMTGMALVWTSRCWVEAFPRANWLCWVQACPRANSACSGVAWSHARCHQDPAEAVEHSGRGGGMAALRDVMVRPIAGGGLADGTADAGGGGSTLPSGGSLADGVSGAGGGGGGGPMAGREAADTVAASGTLWRSPFWRWWCLSAR